MGKYRPRFVTQFDGSKWESENCVAAAGSMALDRHTLGRIRTNAVVIRRLATEANNGEDIQEGLSQTDLEKAWWRGWKEDLQNPLEPELFRTFVEKVQAGRGAVIFGDCSKFRGNRCPAGLSKNHALYVNEVDERDRFYCFDPADRTAEIGKDWISADVLRNYAGSWVDRTGYCNASYTRITEDVDENDTGGGDLADSLQTLAGCAKQLQVITLFGLAIGKGIVDVWNG